MSFVQFAKKNATAIKIIVIAGGLLFASYRIYISITNQDRAAADSSLRYMIDAETGEHFPRFPIKEGDVFPFTNPKTGTRTLYPAEQCWWNPDGSPKDMKTESATRVLLNIDGSPTFCPDCSRLVVRHNPMPTLLDFVDDKPVFDLSRVPPTEAEYSRGRRGSGSRE